MNPLIPHQNVLYCFIGGFISAILMHCAKSVGYAVPDDVEIALPAATTAGIAYLHDCISVYLRNKNTK